VTAYGVKRFLLDILYPNKCPFCDEIIAHNEHYCCLGSFELLRHNSDGAIALFEYNDATSLFVRSIKEIGDAYAVSAVAKLISKRLPAGIDLITCIPSDPSRMRERGYNPPALLASEVSQISGIPCDCKLLIKTRRAQLQKSLSETERRENLRGVFALNKNKTVSGNVLLTDDVRTTGTTLLEASQTLLNAGAEKVFTAVIAATVRNVP
jgi:ComF family protein